MDRNEEGYKKLDISSLLAKIKLLNYLLHVNNHLKITNSRSLFFSIY